MKASRTLVVVLCSGIATVAGAQPAPKVPLRPLKPRPAPTVRVVKAAITGTCDQGASFAIDVESTHSRLTKVMVHYAGSGDLGQYMNLNPNLKVTFSITPERDATIRCGSEPQCWDVWLTPNTQPDSGTTAAMIDGTKAHFCAVNPPNLPVQVVWQR